MRVAWNLGLGDAIACAAIVAKFALDNQNKKIQVPCWGRNFVSVKSFFVNYPNIEIVILEKGEDVFWQIQADLRLGHYDHNLTKLPTEDFVQWFYRQAGFDIGEKGKWCPIYEATEKINLSRISSDKYAFIHQDSERGFNIIREKANSHLPYYSAIKTEKSILHYSRMLQEASEIHCIDSSFIHLVECLPTTGKLFYHKYARPNSPNYKYYKKDWVVIN